MKKKIFILKNLKNYFNLEKKFKIELSKNDYFNLINISLGYYYPISSFCSYNEFFSITKKNKINKNKNWTIPILLNLKNKNKINIKKNYYLSYNNKNVGIVKPSSIFKIDKKLYCQSLFNTNSIKHPSVERIYKNKNLYIGGKVFLLKSKIPNDKFFIYNQLKNNKKFFEKSTIFSTRNICHLGHQAIHKKILKKNDKLTICIIENDKNKYNIKDIVNSYLLLKKNSSIYKNIKIIKIYLPSMFAGPKEAYLQAKLFSNLNFKSFVVGRDHAGYRNYFSRYSSQIFLSKSKGLKINIVKNKEPLLCNICNKIGFEDKNFCRCVNQSKKLTLDGSLIKELLFTKNFVKVKKYLNPIIFDYCKKHINKMRKLVHTRLLV